MDGQQKDTIFLTGEVCEIIQKDGSQCQVRILCKPEYLLLECSCIPDFHLGDKVTMKLNIEAKEILPIANNMIIDTN
jgi:hypothetical protein